jgi:hypothetical protein
LKRESGIEAVSSFTNLERANQKPHRISSQRLRSLTKHDDCQRQHCLDSRFKKTSEEVYQCLHPTKRKFGEWLTGKVPATDKLPLILVLSS